MTHSTKTSVFGAEPSCAHVVRRRRTWPFDQALGCRLLGLIVALALTAGLSVPAWSQTASDLTTYYRYDALRRMTMKISPDPDGAGVGRLRRAEEYRYDADGRLDRTRVGTVTDVDGNGFVADESLTVTSLFDAVGNKTQETSALGLTQYSYDEDGRLDCTAVRMSADAGARLAQPDACLQGAASGNAAGPDRISRNSYDAAGQLTSVERGIGGGLTQPFVETTTYTLNGKVEARQDANHNTSQFVYDGFDRVQVLRMPSKTLGAGTANAGDRELYAYDENGNRVSLTKRDGQVFVFTYDNLNREILKDGPGTAGDVSTDYDLVGNPILVSWPGASVASSYDLAGRRISETTSGPGGSLQIASRYDNAGNRTRVTWGADGGSTYAAYDYYNDGTLKTVTDAAGGLLDTFAYDDLGRPASLSASNGVTTSFQFRAADGLLDFIHHDGFSAGAKIWQGFDYNPAGQIVSQSQSNTNLIWTGQPSKTTAFAYNGLNQNSAVAALANGLCSDPAAGYDCNGNVKVDVDAATNATRRFNYDAENRLIQVVKTDASNTTTTLALSYDPLGRLLTTNANGTVTRFLYDGDKLVGEYDGAGNRLRRYVHGGGTDNPLVWYEGADSASPHWLHVDRQGSVSAYSLSDKSLSTYAYGPYGEAQSWAGSRFRYTGQIALQEVELYYYKARVYDPRNGRFLQTDPIGYKDDLNLYAYVGEDPLNKSDPTGLQSYPASSEENQRVGAEGGHPIRKTVRDIVNWGIGAAEELAAGCLEGGCQGAGVGSMRLPPFLRVKALPAPRVFTASEPLTGELATAIELGVPNSVRGVNVVRTGVDGVARELDIIVGHTSGETIVQVKSNYARGLIGQMQATKSAFPDARVIGYAPGAKAGMLKEAQRQGLTIYTDMRSMQMMEDF